MDEEEYGGREGAGWRETKFRNRVAGMAELDGKELERRDTVLEGRPRRGGAVRREGKDDEAGQWQVRQDPAADLHQSRARPLAKCSLQPQK